MIVVRDIFQAKYGRGNELVALFKEANPIVKGYGRRILTDASGPFFTVVVETEVNSLADWERLLKGAFADKDFAGWFERSLPLVESGRREFYNVEA